LISTTGTPRRRSSRVVVVRGGELSEVAAGEHDPGGVLLKQHVHVVGLGQAARGAGAKHRE